MTWKYASHHLGTVETICYFVSLWQAGTKNIYQPHMIRYPAKRAMYVWNIKESTFKGKEVTLPGKEEFKCTKLWEEVGDGLHSATIVKIYMALFGGIMQSSENTEWHWNTARGVDKSKFSPQYSSQWDLPSQMLFGEVVLLLTLSGHTPDLRSLYWLFPHPGMLSFTYAWRIPTSFQNFPFSVRPNGTPN